MADADERGLSPVPPDAPRFRPSRAGPNRGAFVSGSGPGQFRPPRPASSHSHQAATGTRERGDH